MRYRNIFSTMLINLYFTQAPPESVLSLFLDNSRVREYNEHCSLLKDVYTFSKKIGSSSWSKISWAASPKYPLGLKARDFVSVVNFIKYSNGTAIILNRPAYHPKYSPSKSYGSE